MNLKLKNYQYLMSSSMIRMICTLLATYIFTNFFSIKEFAIYNIIVSLSIIVSGLITSPQYYFLATNHNKSKLIFSSRENINLILSLFIILIFFIYFFKNSIFLISNNKILFFVLFFLSISLALQIVIQNISRIEKNYLTYFKISIVERIFLITIIILALIFELKIDTFLLIFSLFCFIFFISYLIKKKYIEFNFKFLKNKNILKESSYAFLNNLVTISIGLQALIFVSGNFNQYIFTNSISIGLLFLSLATLPLTWVETVVGPIISRIIKTQNTKLLNDFANTNFKSVLYFCFIITILLIFFSFLPYIFEFFFENYSEYKKVVFIFSFLIPVMGSKIYLSWFLVCLKKTKYMLFSNFLVLILFCSVFYILDFKINDFLFYYVLILLFEIIFLYFTFSYFYKLKHIIEIYFILFLTIINLYFYNFYYEIYYYYFYVNFIYVFFYLKKNNVKKFLISVAKS